MNSFCLWFHFVKYYNLFDLSPLKIWEEIINFLICNIIFTHFVCVCMKLFYVHSLNYLNERMKDYESEWFLICNLSKCSNICINCDEFIFYYDLLVLLFIFITII